MSKNKRPVSTFARKQSVIATGLALSLMAAHSVYAQQAAPVEQKAEKIEVTGTRIPPPNLEGASPVTVVDAVTIKVDGVRSAESFLNNLPQVFAAQGANVANGATGTATVNLRGLGASRTLVLVNGRRLPYGSANSASADLNQIPSPLIKRVEILTGGAGAIYGSDAVAGVVNFIMNDRFEGVQFDVNHGFYNHQQQNAAGVADIVRGRAATNPKEFAVPGDKSDDGRIFDANVLMGGNFGNGKGNATVYFGYKKEQALLQSERDFSACSLAASGSVFSCGGSGTNATTRITNLTTGKVYTNGDSNGTARIFSNALDQYNFGPANHFQRPSERYNANASANYDFMPDVKLYSEFAFTDYRSIAQIAPGGVFGSIATVGFDNPLLSPSWKAALGLNQAGDTTDVVVQRRNVEGGGRQSEFRNTSFRTVVGVKGDVGNWSYDAFMQTAKVIYQQTEKNYFENARIDNALDVVNVNGVATCRVATTGADTACVPYNPWQLGKITSAQLNYLQAPGIRTGGTEQMVQGGSISSDLGTYGIKLPTSKNGVAVAVGIERRTEKLDLQTDSLTQTGSLSGSGGPTPGLNGKFTVKDIYAEVRVPILEGASFAELLSANASYRNSDYTTGVKTNTYGFGVEWSPTKQVRLRASYQKAVRAANLIELYQAQGLNLYDNDSDPCAGSAPAATLAQCARTGVTAAQYGNIQDSPAGQYNFLQGGNPNLNPEKAKSNTLGVVFTPMSNLSATVDYFDIKVEDTISIINPVTSLAQCIATGNPLFCSLITRDRLGTLWLLDTARIVGTNQNIGGSRATGIDLGFNYTHKLPNLGSLNVNTVATYLLKAETEEIKGLGNYDCVGLYGNNCGVPNPEWRNKTRATWTTPWNWDLALTWRFFGSVDVDTSSSNPKLAGPVQSVEKTLGSRNYFDLAGSYAVTKQITLRAGINNLFDKDPPITTVSGPSIFGNGNTFPQVYDALGRRVFLNLNAKF